MPMGIKVLNSLMEWDILPIFKAIPAAAAVMLSMRLWLTHITLLGSCSQQNRRMGARRVPSMTPWDMQRARVILTWAQLLLATIPTATSSSQWMLAGVEVQSLLATMASIGSCGRIAQIVRPEPG